MILVFGATGRVGYHVAAELSAAGAAVRCVARDPDKARTTLPSTVSIVAADLDDPTSLARAMQGIDRILLSTPIDPRLAEQQIAVIDAARAGGVRRVVKLSGSAWTLRAGAETTIGALHRASESHLEASGLPSIVVRPNAFMQGLFGRIRDEARTTGKCSLAIGSGRVAAIDIRDLVAVLAHALLAESQPDRVLELTGPSAPDGVELARIASEVLGQPIEYRAVPIAVAGARAGTAFARRHLEEVLGLIANGAAARMTSTVATVLGRPARSVKEFLAEEPT